MESIKKLSPELVWLCFDEILKVPRPSKHEEKIRQHLIEFASKHNLEHKTDSKGNLVILRKAGKSYQNSAAIVLQNHMDMVCEKSLEVSHDFMKDPIDAYIDNGWVRAKGTTLGADCGIGMALAMGALIDPSLDCPPLEALFTVDEEQGLSGAMELSDTLLTGKYLLNLDSEDEGEIFIGCAGGIDTLATFDFEYIKPNKDNVLKISVEGLSGGHSGDDIEKGRGCAIKLLVRVLSELEPFQYELEHIEGGNLRNAIAREAYAVIRLDKTQVADAKTIYEKIYNGIQEEYKYTDKNILMQFSEFQAVKGCVLSSNDKLRLIRSLQCVAHGVISMSFSMPGLVETSTNLASVKVLDNKVVVTTSQRSSIESAKHNIAQTVASTFKLAGAMVEHSDGYPGWTPNPKSKLVLTSSEVYLKKFSKEPKVKAIHAGLECGLILKKYPSMESISIGPTIKGAHSPSESLEIESVSRTWEYLQLLLKSLN